VNVYLLSILYGIIEGLTEFLPVSSTAHLRIAEAFTGIGLDSGYWKMYSVVIQLGAILSVPILFKDRLAKFLHTFPRGDNNNKTLWTHPLSLVILGFLVTAGPCYLADKYIGKNLESLLVISLALIIGGIVMWLVDALFTRPKITRMEDMSPLDAVWIGAVQILSAVFPGTSRSMATIAAGQVFSLSRATALEYSFFLSIPTMLAATGYKLLQTLLHHKTPEEAAAYHAPSHQWLVLLIGFVVSFLIAYLVNQWFINWVRTRGFAPFAIYRILFGAAVLIYALSPRS
jgi:undecaprenyl-diphosphatase